jgi:thiol:disulfide interchange protein DsbA
MQRRDFSRLLSASLAGVALPLASAETKPQPKAPVEGVHYVRLAEPVPAGPPGKIEVIEFFWYECPHCNAFEPALEAWTKQQPDDIGFRRVPVWFREEPFSAQQRLFYALEALGALPTLHRKVFYAIHGERFRMRAPEDFSAFALKNGIDPLKFIAAYNSFGVHSKAQQARQTASAYKIDAVPAMGIQGRYYTNGTLANTGGSAGGSVDRMLGVVDLLVARVRQGTRA